jgi:NAD(P)-dependent dehydrogenase (short-subunit alcohol dehydrogenase family)
MRYKLTPHLAKAKYLLYINKPIVSNRVIPIPVESSAADWGSMEVLARVLVTGAATGIGRAIVEKFARSNCAVHFCDVSADAIATALGELSGPVTASVADVAVEADVIATIEAAQRALGGVDVVVNNAGIGGPRGPLEKTSFDDWRRCQDVNLGGAFLFTKHVAESMKAKRRGSIINISTSSAVTGLPNRSAYVSSKAGLIALTRNSARELGPLGIRCNAILPGVVDNPRGRALVERFARERGLDAVAGEREFLRYVSMRTMVQPSDVAEMAFFLASPAARFVSGQCIGVCGNMEWEE